MPVPEDAATTTSQVTPQSPPFAAGDRVRFESRGCQGGGTVDAAMPDGSVIWVWPDDAMGRRMLHLAEDTAFLLEQRPETD